MIKTYNPKRRGGMFGVNDDQPDQYGATHSSPPLLEDHDIISPPPTSPSSHTDLPASYITTPISAASDKDLLDIKQQALSSLAPLVDQLDQPPEERFKTTMMLIQASDNPNLIKQAYETAKQISDEKARAQALIDIVNEINYFTQHKDLDN